MTRPSEWCTCGHRRRLHQRWDDERCRACGCPEFEPDDPTEEVAA